MGQNVATEVSAQSMESHRSPLCPLLNHNNGLSSLPCCLQRISLSSSLPLRSREGKQIYIDEIILVITGSYFFFFKRMLKPCSGLNSAGLFPIRLSNTRGKQGGEKGTTTIQMCTKNKNIYIQNAFLWDFFLEFFFFFLGRMNGRKQVWRLIELELTLYVCASVLAQVYVCVRACVRAYVCVCVRVCQSVRASAFMHQVGACGSPVSL